MCQVCEVCECFPCECGDESLSVMGTRETGYISRNEMRSLPMIGSLSGQGSKCYWDSWHEDDVTLTESPLTTITKALKKMAKAKVA